MPVELYQPFSSTAEAEARPETEPQTLRGEAVYLIDVATGRVRVGTELINKPLTGRKRGELTIPIETPKIIDGEPEDTVDTARGALSEVLNDQDTDFNPVPLWQYLHILEGASHFNGIHTTIGSRSVTVGYTPVLWSGRDISMGSYNCLEVDNPQWVDPQVLLGDNVRMLAGMVVKDALETGLHNQLLQQYFDQPHLRRPLLPPGFSIGEYYKQREKFPDLT